MLTLRPYQEEAVEAIYQHLRERDDNPCAVLPTASGKTPILARISKDAVGRWKGRVLILAHVKELLEQAVEKLGLFAPELRCQVGVYSAGLKTRDTEHPIIVAGIQSVYRRACELGRFDLVIVDEAHMIPPDGDGMYWTFLDEARTVNPNVRLIGLTATPFRMKSGHVCAPENLLNHVCYEIGVRELIVQGYLCPLVTRASRKKIDTSGLHIRAGEFVAGEAEELMDHSNLVEAACREIVEHARDRKSVLIFAAGVKHGKHITDVLREKHGAQVAAVFGETLSFERDRVLGDFRAGRLKYLVNVNVLTTGFDAPNIDCVAMLRPTMSPGLYYQMVGRGFRLCEGKDDCLVLDFGGNVMRHGPVDALEIKERGSGSGDAPAKECPECQALIATGYAVCPQCGYQFPPPERQMHDAQASTAGILSGQVTVAEHAVDDTHYSVHVKRGAPPGHPATMRVEYTLGFQNYISEWVCLEHSGWARKKAESWWRRRSNEPVPETVEEAVSLARGGALAETKSVTVRSVTGEKYDRIVGYELRPKPAYREPGWEDTDEVTHDAPAYAWAGREGIPF
ncbi:MAG: DEAD/DEAH box helicase family protein [Planctomycetes bacterium]|nr:DEAD/DEAH box helicase family protein [Planctomycetota bacterium]